MITLRCIRHVCKVSCNRYTLILISVDFCTSSVKANILSVAHRQNHTLKCLFTCQVCFFSNMMHVNAKTMPNKKQHWLSKYIYLHFATSKQKQMNEWMMATRCKMTSHDALKCLCFRYHHRSDSLRWQLPKLQQTVTKPLLWLLDDKFDKFQ